MNTQNVIDLENIKDKCRICLQHNDQVIALNCTFKENADATPLLVRDVLENIFSTKLNSNTSYAYPEQVCGTCYTSVEIAYDLKTTFEKSRYILENFLFDLKQAGVDDSLESKHFVTVDEGSSMKMLHIEDAKILDESTREESGTKHFSETLQKVDQDEKIKLNDFLILEVTDDNQENTEVKQETTADNEETGSNRIEDPTKVIANKSETPLQNIVPKYTQILYHCATCNKYLTNKPSYEQHKLTCQVDYCQPFKFILPKLPSCNQTLKIPIQRLQIPRSNRPEKTTRVKAKNRKKPSNVKVEKKISLPRNVRPVKSTNVIACTVCKETFDTRGARSYHLKSKHRDKKFFCEVCNKGYHFKASLDQHMQYHNKDQHREMCPECGKSFHYREVLELHMKFKHKIKDKNSE
ncbi:hypothetical protein NQ315_001184 [Exocentrus adspersus]|uniref:Uncharacterized protein n=1 Tax=Exocentrus adspersus TaxID=1586481 RepID=A0AAV8WER4_9CUCU|nr:hypothetical protein NQ315_001184 [Exocentrus adspersus]